FHAERPSQPVSNRPSGELRGLEESLSSVARRKTAANGRFRRISAPGPRRAFLNLRLRDFFESETRSHFGVSLSGNGAWTRSTAKPPEPFRLRRHRLGVQKFTLDRF